MVGNSEPSIADDQRAAHPERIGPYDHSERDSISWAPPTGPHAVSEEIRDAWTSIGWENSELGFPAGAGSDIDGGGHRQEFGFGAIQW